MLPFRHISTSRKIIGLLVLAGLSSLILIGVIVYTVHRIEDLSVVATQSTQLLKRTGDLRASQEAFFRNPNQESSSKGYKSYSAY